MSLSTGERIHRSECTSLPMPKDFIDRVHMLATSPPTEIAFEDKYGNIIEDESGSDRNIELDKLGITVIKNNHSEDKVEDGNQLRHTIEYELRR
jgi:hypothetical protein